MSTVTLTGGGHEVVLHGDGSYRGPGIALTGIQGWYETPSAKVSTVSRGTGDGGHDIAESDIAYEARVVTLGYRVLAAADRGLALRLLQGIDRLAHTLVTCRVEDDACDSYCIDGYYARGVDQKTQNPIWQNITGEITLVFERPERMSHEAHSAQLIASDVTDGQQGVGLSYSRGFRTYWTGDRNASASVLETTNAGTTGLAYPLAYSVGDIRTLQSVAQLRNNGSSRAYPVFTVHGPMPHGVTLVFSTPSTQLELSCSQPVHGVPLTLDCRSRTATIGGLDVSRTLTSRGFPVIQPGSSINVALQSSGSGFVDCEAHDTYM